MLNFNQTKKVYFKKKAIVIIISAIFVIYAIGLPISLIQQKLTGKDLAAYNLIIKGSYYFDDPTSVRVVSGYVDNGNTKAWFMILATNSYGIKTNEPYYFCQYGESNFIVLRDEISDYHKKTDCFNIEKVNAALSKKWSKI